MHVNQPTPLLRIVLWRILYISFTAAAIIAYLLLWSGSTLAEEIITTDILNLSSPIVKMLDEYGDRIYLPEGKAESYSVISRPIILNIEDVSVTLRKTIYDGTWLYTSVSAIPLDSSTYLLPGDAQPSDPAKSFYKENTREEERSFLQVAKEDGKQLLAVYIYIKEFDEIGAYFLDHLQVSESTSMLYSGAKLGYGNKPAHVTWIIQTYKVNLETEEYALKDEMLIPVVVPPLQPYLEGLYVASADELLTEVMLIQTPLNIYIIPQ